MPEPVTITVFTPVYNRIALLPRLYHSLLEQHYPALEWVIVDDGSTEDIRNLVRQLSGEEKLTIRYHYQQNAGKHIAMNRGAALATGELFFIVDNDDYLPAGTLQHINRYWQQLQHEPEAPRFAGICGLKAYPDGLITGGDVSYEQLDTNAIDYRYTYRFQGDKAEVYRTRILQQFPYPEIAGERFCTEALVYNRIARHFLLRYINEVFYYCEYLPGGLSDRSVSLRKNNPRYASLYYAELAGTPGLPFRSLVRTLINYWRFAVYDRHTPFREKRKRVKQHWSLLFLPLCYLLRLAEGRKDVSPTKNKPA